MDLLRAVVADLAHFAIHSLRSQFVAAAHAPAHQTHHPRHAEHDYSAASHEVIYAAPRPERLAIPAPKEESEAPLPHAHLDAGLTKTTIAPQKNTVVYVATSDAPLRLSPVSGTDNVIARMPYGAMLVAMETTGDWVHVFYRGIEGYVELRDLAEKAAHVYPKFIIGEANHADDPNTERVRAVIGDEFSYGEGSLPLQAEEYALYKLMRNGVDVEWGTVRPRKAGSWASVAGGKVERTLEPAPRSLVEWTMHDGTGHIAFVESVLPDGTITISETNWPEEGVYNERVLVREEWMALAPTFIRFS